jgi:membrane fusion protein, macrolide-specific efflux system
LRAIEPGPDTTTTNSSSTTTSSSSTAIYYTGLFDVPNPGRKLRVSMTAQVSIVQNIAKQALCIPTSALGEKGKDGRSTVRVLVNNLPENRMIRTGINNNVLVQVTDGLQEGDRVIIGDSSTLPAPEKTTPAGPPRGR